MKRMGIVAVYTVGALAVWQAAVPAFHVPAYLLPTPTTIAAVLMSQYLYLLEHMWITLGETAAGFLIAAVFGCALALLVVAFVPLRYTVYPTLVGLNALPKVAIAPLLVIWFGVGFSSKAAMSFFIAFFPILINAMAGLERVDPDLLELMRSLRASKRRIFTEVRIPNAIPYVFEGLKIAMPLAVIGSIVGEFLGSQAGLGFVLLSAQSALNTPFVFAALLWITGMSLALFGLIGLARRFAVPWERRAE